jgi:hypothetical protein
MTARKIFDGAMALLFAEEADYPDYEPFWMRTLNRLIAETFAGNNGARTMRGKEKLAGAPVLNGFEDDLEYETEYTRYILPYGCAGYIGADDDSTAEIAQAYRSKYEYERTRPTIAVQEG